MSHEILVSHVVFFFAEIYDKEIGFLLFNWRLKSFNSMTVYDILSFLKPPSERKDNPVNKSFTGDSTDSHSTEFQSDTKNHIKEYAEESSATARKELREKGSDHDSMIKVVKIEPVDKVIIDVDERAVSENGRVPQARSSSFQPRYGYTFCCISGKKQNCLTAQFGYAKYFFSYF